jgi:hypothetical protein
MHPTLRSQDDVSWALEASGGYSPNSLYLQLLQGANITHFQEVWIMKVPPKIKVLLWQKIRDRLPSGEELAKRNDPSVGRCALSRGVGRLRPHFLQLQSGKIHVGRS